ncbi:Rox3 mediator complex subunit-domain-containing protein [Terfezia claveryi]|nr:Rox3 mediator complex subunit-domain-containing protein [Terfezia claveryi]
MLWVRSGFDEDNYEVAKADIPPVTDQTTEEILEQTNVHPLPLLCQQRYVTLFPRPITSIFPMYSLTSIAESVARQDPAAGERRTLRKSYKGKIIGLAGKPEIPKEAPSPAEGELGLEGAAPPPINQSMSLLEMMEWPEEEWRAQKVTGKDLHAPLPQDALKRALEMAVGQIPRSSLGLDSNKASSTDKKSTSSTQSPSAFNATPVQQHHGATPWGDGLHASVSSEVLDDRPHGTRGIKRQYDDNSFEGYGDGYEDNEWEEGVGGGEGNRRKKKKNRKVHN